MRVVPLTRPQSTTRHNLPAHSSTFIGRDREVGEGIRLLTDHRLVTLVGTGGIGKTRLAFEVAAGAAPAYADGAWVVELAGLHDPDLVADAVLAALPTNALNDAGSPDLPELLKDRDLLMVLDNCEHVLSGCSALIDKLLRACAGLTVLTTSREPLGTPGETLFRLRPMGLPGPNDLDTVTVGGSEAVSLFVERGRGADPDFSLTADVLPAVVEICRRLDGLPLAIELAAARLAVLSPADILERLDDRFRVLVDRGTATPVRHQTLAAAIDWSYGLLLPEEARLFRRLAVFAGGWRLEAAREVCTGDGLAGGNVLGLLEALVAKSLVVVDRNRRVIRYRMLESVRHFALERLTESGERGELDERHASWCVILAERAAGQRRGREHDSWLRALEEDHNNFRAALTWARESQHVDTVLALGGSLSWFWETRGHLREGLEWLRWAVAHDPGEDYERRAQALRAAGVLSWLLGEVTAAMPLVEESVALFRQAGNEEEAAGCVCSNAFHLCANPAHTLTALEENVARIRGEENLDRLAHALVNCGMAQFFVGDLRRAQECFDECLAMRLGAVEAEVMSAALLGVGRVALLTGRFDDAYAAFGEALDITQLTGDDDSRSTALSWIAELSRIRGDHERARALMAGAVQLVETDGPTLSLARCRQFLGRVELAAGHLEAARTLFNDSLAPPGSKEMPYHYVRSLLGLAEAAAASGNPDEARTVFERALAAARTNGDRQAEAQALCGQARLVATDGHTRRATRLAHEGLELVEDIGDVVGITGAVETLAELAAVAGRPLVAARLYGAADRARADLGAPRTAGTKADRARCVRRLTGELGRSALTLALADGSSLTLPEAVSFAAKGWDRRARPPTGWASLTRAERDVAALAAEDLTLAEIAARLFVSPRTVATHLAHIYRKLDIGSKRELGRAAREAYGSASPGGELASAAVRERLLGEEWPRPSGRAARVAAEHTR